MVITGDNGANVLEGGWGGQTILGLGGADVIHGDPTTAPASPFFLVASVRDALAFDGAFRAVSVAVGDATFVYGTSIEDGGLTGWSLDADGALEEIFSWTTFGYAGPVGIGGRALMAAEFGGGAYLLSAGFGLSISAVGADGTLTHLSTIHDDATLNIDRPAAVSVFEVDGMPYAVAAGRNGAGISVFRIDPTLGFVPVQNISDSADTTLRLVSDIETVLVGDAAFVVATGYYDSGVTVFSVGAGGVLTRTAHDSTELNLYDSRLDGAQTLASHVAGGVAYLYVGAEFGAISVYEVDAAGALILRQSLPGACRDLQVGMFAGEARLIATGAGPEVAVYDISAAGLLTPAAGFTAGADAGAVGVIGTPSGVYLAIARGVEDGFDLHQAAVGGDDVIDGGGGNDRIYGGAGADTINGGAGADQIWGEDGDDFIFGDDGGDVIRGGDGDDWIEGGAGDDVLRGGAGADTLHGNDGRDTLYGGSAADVLTGGNGLDKLFGGIGADVLMGGPGADRLVGNNGNDHLIGGASGDVLEAGPGADILEGEDGDDRLKGGSGRDVLTGGAGADIFEFAKNSGKDVITDFDRAEDLIEIVGWPGGYGALTIEQAGADVLVTFGSVEITVWNATVGDLDAGAFLFT